jgi:hypothetical protein
MKSHTPECAKIEQFAATLVPMRSYHLCTQDFDTKDYTLEFHGRSIAITQQQFDDGTWQEVVKIAFQ